MLPQTTSYLCCCCTVYFTTDVVFHAEILRHIQNGQLFKQSLAFVYQNYALNYLLSEHLFLWTVLRRLNPNSGRTFTLLNQSFYREYLRAIFCTTTWLPNICLGQQQQLFQCQWILKWIGLILFTREKHDMRPLTKHLVFLSNPNHGLGWTLFE